MKAKSVFLPKGELSRPATGRDDRPNLGLVHQRKYGMETIWARLAVQKARSLATPQYQN